MNSARRRKMPGVTRVLQRAVEEAQAMRGRGTGGNRRPRVCSESGQSCRAATRTARPREAREENRGAAEGEGSTPVEAGRFSADSSLLGEALKRSRHLSTGTASTSTAVAEPSATSPVRPVRVLPTAAARGPRAGFRSGRASSAGDSDDGRCRAPGLVTEDVGRCAHEALSSILETLDCRRQPESPFGTLELGETRFSRAFAGHSRLPLLIILHCFVAAGDDHGDQAETSRLASLH